MNPVFLISLFLCCAVILTGCTKLNNEAKLSPSVVQIIDVGFAQKCHPAEFSVSWHPSGQTLIFSDATGEEAGLCIAQAPDFVPVKVMEPVTQAVWTPDGYHIAALSTSHLGEFTVSVLDLQGNLLKTVLIKEPSWIAINGWRGNHRLLLNSHRGSEVGILLEVDLEKQDVVHLLSPEDGQMADFGGRVFFPSPDQRRIAVQGWRDAITVVDTNGTVSELAMRPGGWSSQQFWAWTPEEGRFLYSQWELNRDPQHSTPALYMWDQQTGKAKLTPRSIWYVNPSPRGNYVSGIFLDQLAGWNSLSIAVMDATTYELRSRTRLPKSIRLTDFLEDIRTGSWQILWLPGEDRFVYWDTDGTVWLQDAVMGRRAVLLDRVIDIREMALSPDGSYLALRTEEKMYILDVTKVEV